MKFLRLTLEGLPEADQAIYLEQLREHWRLDVWTVPGQAVVLLALAPVIARSDLTPWQWGPVVALLLGSWAWGALSQRRLRHVHFHAGNYPGWRRLTLGRELVQSAAWGGLGALLWGALPDTWHLLILSGLIVFAFTAMFFSTHDSGVATAAIVPTLVILLLRLQLDGGDGTGIIALILAVSMLTCLGVGRLIETRLLEGERLRLRNAQLLSELEQEINKVRLARDEAQEANRQKSAFLAAASHDLRQPLHSLTLLSGLLTHSTDEATPPRLKQTAQRMQSAVDGLSFVFDQLFDIARLDAGKQVHQPRALALHALLRGLHQEYAAAFEHKGLAWTLQLPAKDAPEHWALADPLFVQRVLRNLLDNALRYTATGQVRLRLRPRGGQLAVQVWDTGPGIERTQRLRVFDDYVQGHNPQRQRHEGLGLGLAMVRRLVAAGGYALSLRTRLGQGCCFSLSLPASPAPDQPVPSAAAAQHLGSPIPTEGPAPLLVLIDDDDEVLLALQDSLQDLGWATACGHSAREAVEAVAAVGRMPLAVLSDWRLGPDEQGQAQDGLGCIHSLRHEFGLTLPAWLLTGDLDPALARRCADAQVGLLRKPLSAGGISALLRPTPPRSTSRSTPVR
jgi:signal transduction histidine kinase